MSQTAIADKLHMSQNAYSMVENGKTRIDEERIIQLSKILGVHPFELLDDSIVSEFSNKNNRSDMNDIQPGINNSKEVITILSAQLEKKDEQIDKLLQHIQRLSESQNLKK